MKKIVGNKRFCIQTNGEFEPFVGVSKSKNSTKLMINIIFSNGGKLCCTEDHEIIFKNRKIKASDLKIGNIIQTTNGQLSILDKIAYKEKCNDVYDIIHVNQRHTYDIKILDSCIEISNCILVDELAFVNKADEFYESVYPTISSGDNTKVIITSTPRGMNFFYKMWTDAEMGKSDYIAYDVKWYENPNYDQKWYNTMTKNMNKSAINQEIHCVKGDTYITIDNVSMRIEELYNKYRPLNNSSLKDIVYIQHILIDGTKK